MNWGHKLTLAFIAFIVMIMYFVVKSFMMEVDLVSEDYYNQELAYQTQIEKIQNTKSLSKPIQAVWNGKGIYVSYPEEQASGMTGTLQLYRPSMVGADKQYKLEPDSKDGQLIPRDGLLKGKYILKIDWSDGTKEYYQEIVLFVP